MKPFLPQMQSVFLKILPDETSQNLRQLVTQSIHFIVGLLPKADVMYKELLKIRDEKGIKSDPYINDLIAKVDEKVNTPSPISS